MSGSVEFLRNKVKFDGFKNGVLLEAKGAYLWLFKTGRATQKKNYTNFKKNTAAGEEMLKKVELKFTPVKKL
ncbi:Tox-REase-5 domain-containing protein [Mucilaginibacter sp.]|uniref:Tox-REase-5 domain-containing protein n=1 Tax=Mucilaginibacter sp. TaxID=1882438 RepID=UPI002635B2A6|nr:Tox-REase-5 domain-containing protein [Mucilaginibacter sp.]